MTARDSFPPVILVAVLLSSPALAATPRPTPQAPVVIKVTSELVQVDAVVTDGKGRHVTDLVASDFEIVEDGKTQRVTHCEFIAAAGPPEAAPAPGAAAPIQRPLPPREDVRRVLVLVVDDLGLSMTALSYAREALTTFLGTQTGQGDLTAILRTGAPAGLRQQLTNDKAVLRAAIDQLRYNALSSQARSARAESLEPMNRCEPPFPPTCTWALQAMRRQKYIKDTLLSLQGMADAMLGLPGRKGLVVFSERLSLRDETTVPSDETRPAPPGREVDPMLVEEMRRFIEKANRASVVVHTIDPRGLLHLLPNSEEKKSAFQEISEDQAGLQNVAADTGGTFHPFVSDIPAAIGRVMHDLGGYYLLGYTPPEATPGTEDGRRRYHELKLRVKRSGLKVRSRRGYFGATEDEREAVTNAQLPTSTASAAVSPFQVEGVRVHLETAVGPDRTKGSLLRAFVDVEGADITFAEQADGSRLAVLELHGLVFGENGRLVEEQRREIRLPVSSDVAERLRRATVPLDLSFRLEQAGPYQVRTAVLDTTSRKAGAAARFRMVPDLGKRRLALSGLRVSGRGCGDDRSTRRFCSGDELVYAVGVYHSKVDKEGMPRLQTQLRLSREGRVVYEGQPKPVESPERLPLDTEGKLVAFSVSGGFRLSAPVGVGQYTLEVVVTDTLEEGDRATLVEAAGFELVR